MNVTRPGMHSKMQSGRGYGTGAPLQVVYFDPGGIGYLCVRYMARLAAELLDGELLVLQMADVGWVQKTLALLPRSHGDTDCLLICPSPYDLCRLLQVANWRKKYRKIGAWVFDSFWTQFIPGFLRRRRLFDHVFVTEQEDLQTWRDIMHAPVDWLSWGSDVLRLGSDNPSRRFDLLRFGRQPSQWDDDDTTAAECVRRGLAFHGRPASLPDDTDNQLSLMKSLSDAKFTVAFSNRVNQILPSHPTREYLTGRWTDSLAAGVTIAGIPPRSETVSSLLWPEALLDLGTIDRSDGLTVLSAAAQDWTPAHARLNYLRSLERLDWRWRFKRLSEIYDTPAPKLHQDLAEMQAILASDLEPCLTGASTQQEVSGKVTNGAGRGLKPDEF